MNITKYTKLLDSIERKLKKGDLNLNNLGDYIEDQLGIKMKNIHLVNDDIDQEITYHQFEQKYNELFNTFVHIIESISALMKNPDPFSIKYSSPKITNYFSVIKKYKNDDNYEIVLLQVLDSIEKDRKDIVLTKELVSVLKRKYLLR